jgi:hypothetical protein
VNETYWYPVLGVDAGGELIYCHYCTYRLASQYQKAVSEVNETYQFYVSMLEERRAELTRELEQAYSTKQVALSVYSQKAQETVDKIFQVSRNSFQINLPTYCLTSTLAFRVRGVTERKYQYS